MFSRTFFSLAVACVLLASCATAADGEGDKTGQRGFITPAGISMGITVSKPPIPHFYTVTVGVDRYKEESLNLRYAAKDARALHDQISPYAVQSTLLLNEDATRENILGRINAAMNAAKAGDTLVIFIASHGVLKYNDFYILGSDTLTDNVLGTGIPAASLINALSMRFQEGLNVLLILDTCHSGGIGFDVSKFYKDGASSGMTLFVSSQPNEFSMEGPQYGGGHGVFTHFLVEGLSGAADTNKDNVVSLREAFNHTYDNVRNATGHKQHPVLIGTLKNELPLRIIGIDKPPETGSAEDTAPPRTR